MQFSAPLMDQTQDQDKILSSMGGPERHEAMTMDDVSRRGSRRILPLGSNGRRSGGGADFHDGLQAEWGIAGHS